MSLDPRDLYQSVVLEHAKSTRNRGIIEGPGAVHGRGDNPMCGDVVDVYARVRDGVVCEVAFEGDGCAISSASASVMSDALRGKTLEEAEALFERFQRLVTGREEPMAEGGAMEMLSGVSRFPMRVKCATLAWHAFREAVSGAGDGFGGDAEGTA